MNFRAKYPGEWLQTFVRHYWVFDLSQEDLPCSQVFFPYGSHELIFYLQGEAHMNYMGGEESFVQPKSFYSGQFTRPFELNFHEPCKCVGVSLYPWFGNLLYKVPSDHFTNSMIPVYDLEKSNLLFDQLREAKTDSELFSFIEKYLQEKFWRSDPDGVTVAIAKHILKNPETDQLDHFLSNINLSKRRLQQRFKETTGLTMRLFLRKIRFQKSLHLLRVAGGSNLTHVALESGYYDQAHFIHEFKEFTNCTPKDFVRQNSELKSFFKSLVITN